MGVGQSGLYDQGSEAPRSGGNWMFAAGTPHVAGPQLLRALMMLVSHSLFMYAPSPAISHVMLPPSLLRRLVELLHAVHA